MITVFQNERDTLKHNFGDEISQMLITKMTGQNSVAVSVPKDANLVGIGSVMEHFTRRDFKKKVAIWGAGFIQSPNLKKISAENLEIFSVRGRKTADILGFEGALGDPALLMSKYFPIGAIKKKNKIGIIPHYVDKKSEFLNTLDFSKYFIIDVEREPLKVIEDIAAADAVLSSSLHGLILADAYNVPNAWIELSDGVVGSGFKFSDYFSGVNREFQSAIKVRTVGDFEIAEKLLESWHPLENLESIQDGLEKALYSAIEYIQQNTPIATEDNWDFLLAGDDELFINNKENIAHLYTGRFNYLKKVAINPTRMEMTVKTLKNEGWYYKGMTLNGFSVFAKRPTPLYGKLFPSYWRGTWDVKAFIKSRVARIRGLSTAKLE